MHLIFRQCKINNSVQLKNFLICVSKFLFEKYMTNFSTKALPLWTDSGFKNNRNGFKKQNVSVFPKKFNFVTKIRPLSIQFSFSDPKHEEINSTNTYVNKVFALRSLSIPKVGPGIFLRSKSSALYLKLHRQHRHNGGQERCHPNTGGPLFVNSFQISYFHLTFMYNAIESYNNTSNSNSNPNLKQRSPSLKTFGWKIRGMDTVGGENGKFSGKVMLARTSP